MPLYDISCDDCDGVYEHFAPLEEFYKPLPKCPTCDAEMFRLIRAPFIIGDYTNYKSLQDGSQITSRAEHREHLKRHDMVEFGDAPTRSMEPEKYEKKVDWQNAVGETYAELKVTGKIDD
jgi:putative FmdB family regulatory protein